MVKISSSNEIDRKKLIELFKKRGHGLLRPFFFQQVDNVLKNQKKESEVHQCECGEVTILPTDMAEKLRLKLKTNELPCKNCSTVMEISVLNMSIVDRFKSITDFYTQKAVWLDHSFISLTPEDVNTLREMTQDLFPTNTHAEMIVGYYDFMHALYENFPRSVNPYEKMIFKIFSTAESKSSLDFKKIHDLYTNWKNIDRAGENVFNFKYNFLQLQSEHSAFAFLSGEPIKSVNELKRDSYEIRMKLTEYNLLVEIKGFLDILLNISFILKGKRCLYNPFNSVTLPPRSPSNRSRLVKSLANKIEYLTLQGLSIDFTKIYNTHLRNAVAHNEFTIDETEQKIVLTKYSEELSFSELENISNNLHQFQYAVANYLSRYHVEILRLQVKNQGIATINLGYTDFYLENEVIKPKVPCFPQLTIYQFWNFSTYDNDKRIFPIPKLVIDIETKDLIIDFGYVGSDYSFKKGTQLTEWLEQVVLTGRICLALYTIAPVLPKFKLKEILRLNVKKIIEVCLLKVETTYISGEKFINTAKKGLDL